ncbi:alanine racemase [Clostridium saccharobutylicum]|uniref:Alanine racemase n=1 Tax=Clostridium saccharobutylicum DSM 13864 TaxID=1345695 RepID=U5MYS6_CLOSA|nr:alanine racemase [Clostridium saccharobutylicum]AGX44811.1 alanine racemase Alr [Clostridium saccharobutylicum DSM 13864]AQR92096.1 alanine racemase [Clostridium saccharobutylicum]AQS01998.1 alanine racemase [Clostridium saccharobutylicum]AQS11602.1 alanine racemase [Clostridium saccharobutylicum]AQS15981.1 alanine racemase [Clostridium saccharobutylicum]
MEKILRPVWAEIDLDAIAFNMKNIKKLAQDKEVIAVVKADCYGHGAVDVAPILIENGASRLAVAVLSEGIELRKSRVTEPIMILGYTPSDFGEELINYDIEQTVYDLEYAKELSKIALSLNKKAKIHIALDTGMGRIGFIPSQESLDAVTEICGLGGLDVIGIFTHFSTSDEQNKDYTYEQFKKYTDFVTNLSKRGIQVPLKHVSNSGAIIDLKETYLDSVRAGIILYGYYPSNDINKENLSLKPALTLKTRIAHIKEMDENMYISYGRTFKTERKSIIATIPIGYADGYSRLLAPNAKVIINGKFAKVVGRICMDQCMIDVTDIEDVKINDEVIILGEDGNLKMNADDLAEIMGTINYEILCMLKERIPRVYIKNNEIVKVRNYIG